MYLEVRWQSQSLAQSHKAGATVHDLAQWFRRRRETAARSKIGQHQCQEDLDPGPEGGQYISFLDTNRLQNHAFFVLWIRREPRSPDGNRRPFRPNTVFNIEPQYYADIPVGNRICIYQPASPSLYIAVSKTSR